MFPCVGMRVEEVAEAGEEVEEGAELVADVASPPCFAACRLECTLPWRYLNLCRSYWRTLAVVGEGPRTQIRHRRRRMARVGVEPLSLTHL